MRENFMYGSVRGAAGNGSPYRDSQPTGNGLSVTHLFSRVSDGST